MMRIPMTRGNHISIYDPGGPREQVIFFMGVHNIRSHPYSASDIYRMCWATRGCWDFYTDAYRTAVDDEVVAEDQFRLTAPCPSPPSCTASATKPATNWI